MNIEPGDRFIDGGGLKWTAVDDENLTLDQDDSIIRSARDVHDQCGPLFPVRQPAPPTSPPNYYQFPGGVQVIDISRHLTSNAGQAVQYLARSSRIDGVNKDDPVRDLLKARDMIDDELARLGAAS